MYLAGFSINVLSMLAIVLAVGLVVDDAIVMTENIYVRIEKECPERGRYRGSQRNLLCRNLYHHYAGSGILSHRIYGRYDGTSVP